MFWRKKSYFDNSAPDIKNRRKQPCQVRYMAPIEQFFVTLNVATPDLFARFDKRKDWQKLRQAINPSAGMLRSGLKNWPPWLLTVTKMVTASHDWAVTEPWHGPWLSCDLAVTEPRSYWRCSQPAVTSPWLSCDLAVTELWPSRDWAVTSPWLSCDLA